MEAKVMPRISSDMLTVNGKIRHMARYPNFDSAAVRFNGTSADATSPERVKIIRPNQVWVCDITYL